MSGEPTESDGLLDVSGLSLADLDDADQSALARALRRLVEVGEGDLEPFAGFSQSIDRGTEPSDRHPK
ncbi:FxSxx-COOH cyclophane-containing RiPP peptide [Sphaerisporangium corydalis]|uniref:FxSxx-COOH cyclophane-containing RiPP peptide n=1 Tax=Sphaerisporangium corydalis TaxID=1441875 RepID=A0ABV9ENL2_9ACTN|nr:FxSxx-COOH cyclophane-containing RiPP peptide [Sphaerisporangium corydalis]